MEEPINDFIKHPFINKSEVADLMRPGDRLKAQKVIWFRAKTDARHPPEEVQRITSELESLEQLIKQIKKKYL